MSSPLPDEAAPRFNRQVVILYAIFFVSGFCGLIYESIWSHYLKLLLGHAAYAQAVVLVVFVGGLALGAWFTGLFSERIKHPILIYAAVEAVVGLFAFSFQRLFEGASAWATASFLPAVCGEPGSCAASWLLATALILPPSVLLGTTFPLMSVGVMRLGVRPGRGLSLLYFLNSAGAALGVIGSGFFLIPEFGLPGTMLLAGSMNVLVALAAVIAWKGGDSAAPVVRVPASAAPALPAPVRVLLLVAALTGLSSFIYEVVWIRMLTLVFGAATHSFELMLSPFILGLALGAWWIRDRIDGAAQPLRLLGIIQVAMGLLAVATLPLYISLYDVMAFLLRNVARTEEGYALFHVLTAVMAAAVMLPATVCAGMTLPLITAMLLRSGHGERQVGQIYGVNTFGAIAGVLLSVHLLMPLLGLKWSLALAGAIDVALGLALLWMAARPASVPGTSRPAVSTRLAALGLASVAILAGVPLLAPLGVDRMASGVFRTGIAKRDAGMTAAFHQDGKTATVSLLRSEKGALSLLTNGKSDGASHPDKKFTTPDDHTMILTGVLGPAHHPQARRVAVIGLGTGTSTAVLLESPHVQVLDTIEIEPMMVEAARQFQPRVEKAFTDPRSRIIIDDARAHFSKTKERYDLIISEPSNPWVSGVSGLFTMEFYRHISAHLAADGHFVQWLQLYDISPEVASSIIRAFATVFPEYIAYATNVSDVVLVARNDGRTPVLDTQALDAMPGIQANLIELGIHSGAMLAAHETGPAQVISLLARSYGAPPNSDFFPYVDNHAAASRFQRRNANDLFSLPMAPVPVLDYARGTPAYTGHVASATSHMPQHVVRKASGAQSLRFLQGQPLDARQQALIRPMTMELALVRSWASNCAFPQGTGHTWDAMVLTAAMVNPVASPAEAAAYWKSLGSRCAKTLQPVQASWIDLFAAVASRDREASRIKGLQVLADDAQITPDARAYATLAAVAAMLGEGRRSEAAQVLETQRAKLGAAHFEQPWFRYLVLAVRQPAGRTNQP